jgi:hypothetical protein
MQKTFVTTFTLTTMRWPSRLWGANLDTSVAQPGNHTYSLRNELYRRMGSLLPQAGKVPKFAQLYISDPHAKFDRRMGNFGSLNRTPCRRCK